MLFDAKNLRGEFEQVHAAMDRETLSRILGVDNPKSRYYQMPSELLDKTLKAVREGYEDFAQERPEYPQYFTEGELATDLDGYLDTVEKGAGKSALDIDWNEILGVRFPDEGDFTSEHTESVPYADGSAQMPVQDFDDAAYQAAFADAMDEARRRAPDAVRSMSHDFERDKAFFVAHEAGWKGPLGGSWDCGEYGHEYYDNTETFAHPHGSDWEPDFLDVWSTGPYEL